MSDFIGFFFGFIFNFLKPGSICKIVGFTAGKEGPCPTSFPTLPKECFGKPGLKPSGNNASPKLSALKAICGGD